MTERYYKVSGPYLDGREINGQPTPIKVLTQHMIERRKVQKANVEFAKSLGGDAVTRYDHTIELYGVANANLDLNIWTKPKEDARGAQRLRTKPVRKRGFEASIREFNRLKKVIGDLPTTKQDDQWAAFGITSLDLALHGGRMLADYEGQTLYLATSYTQLPDFLPTTEITGSEYEEAAKRCKNQTVPEVV